MKQQKQISHYCYNDEDCVSDDKFIMAYKGKDTNNGETVKIVIIDMALFTQEGMQAMLDNEIAMWKLLQGDGIKKLIDVLANSKSTVVISEFNDGGDLRKDMQFTGGRSFELHAQGCLRQLMAGFKQLARNGVIHRDIKPESCQLIKGEFKLSNFASATHTDKAGAPIKLCQVGVPIYTSPQFLTQQPYTAKCDIWSIGILAYEMVYGRQPWPCRDCKSYLQNVKNTPLQFPYLYDADISDQYKDFIKKCLVIEEEGRMDWDELFKHPVMCDSDNSRSYTTHQVDERSREILHNIKSIAQSRGLIVKQCFQDYDCDRNGNMDLMEFHNFIQMLDPRVTCKECCHLFKLFDLNKDSQLQIDEFSHIFCNVDFSDPEDVSERLLLDLKEIVKANNINLQQLYDRYDTDLEGDLDINEFTRLIQAIAPDIKFLEIEQIFKRFDKNNDQGVSYIEFLKEMQYGTAQDKQFNPKKEKAQKALEELKRVVKQKNMSVQTLMMIFDSNQNNKLELHEFTQLCKLLDPTSIDEEQQLVFQLLDTNNDGVLVYEEIAKILV